MNNPNDQEQGQQINIELGEKEAEGTYSNFVIITHSNAEVILDFTRLLPGVPKARVLSRIVMTPQHAKLLLGALQNNIINYEQQYGEIMINNDSPMMFGNDGGDQTVH
ncbi:MAG: DUF3467 domain-containing protein [Candidatus Kapabacteria bacterium]|nr:DUF3467 domain-containing protein [Candidatus Kapabacteria bacterium]